MFAILKSQNNYQFPTPIPIHFFSWKEASRNRLQNHVAASFMLIARKAGQQRRHCIATSFFNAAF